MPNDAPADGAVATETPPTPPDLVWPTHEKFVGVVDRRSAAKAVWIVAREREKLDESRQITRDQLAEIETKRAEACAELEAKLAAVRAPFDAQQAEVEQWLLDEHKRLEATEAWLLPQLQKWHEDLLAADPKPWAKKRDKSIPLPGGTLRAERPADEWTWHDEDALVAWLAGHGHEDLLRSKPDKVGVKKLGFAVDPDGNVYTSATEAVDKETGELVVTYGDLVDGVTVTRPEPKFRLETAGDRGRR